MAGPVLFLILANVTKKSVLQEEVGTGRNVDDANPSRYTVEEGPYPYAGDESFGNHFQNDANEENREEYEASLNSEDKQRFETYQSPWNVMGPRENYFTVQKGNRRYDTVITQSFGKKEAQERQAMEQADPALGSEYVSFPQDSLKDNDMETYWDYVPIDNRLDFPRGRHTYFPVQGMQRSVEHGKVGVKNLGDSAQKKADDRVAPNVFTDRHSVGEESKVASAGGGRHGKKSEKLNAGVLRKIKEEQHGRKRQHSNIVVRNRSPEPNGKQIMKFQQHSRSFFVFIAMVRNWWMG